jgi:photosystem II stability/assembly factor-like uncharacterized protein
VASEAVPGGPPLPELTVSVVRPFQSADPDHHYISSVDVLGHLAMVAGGTYHRLILLASTDGEIFRERRPPSVSGLRRAWIRSDGTIWLVGEYGLVAWSRDRGITWKKLRPKVEPCLWDIAQDEAGQLWIAGDEGTVLRSQNEGRRWEEVAVELEHRDPRPDPKLRRVPAGLFFCTFAALWGGQRFFRPSGIDAGAAIAGVAASPQGIVLAVGDDGQAYRSTDGGLTFEAVATGVETHLEDVAWVAEGFVVVGDRGTILRSADGARFTRVPSKAKAHLWAIGSWGTGAFVGGSGALLLRLQAPGDRHWEGAPPDPSASA